MIITARSVIYYQLLQRQDENSDYATLIQEMKQKSILRLAKLSSVPSQFT
jgi:hypothetical protein